MILRISFGVACLATATSALGSTVSIAPENFAPNPTVITFETGSTALPVVAGVNWLADNLFPISQWPRGTHWFGSSGSFANLFDGGYGPIFGDQAMGDLIGYPGSSDIGLTLDAPVQALGAWLRGGPCCSAEAVEFRVLDSTSSLLASQMVLLPVDLIPVPYAFVGFYSTEGISRVEWRLVGDIVQSGGFIVDNITFGNYQAVVPVPPALTLFSPALGLLAFVRRRPLPTGCATFSSESHRGVAELTCR